MKSIWQGNISFGLVSIPIKLFSAINSRTIKFRLLHKKDKSPVKYKRVCEKENKEIDWKDIVKGIEIRKGHFYALSDEELEKLKPEKKDFIEIKEFVNLDQVDPIYFNNHYYVAPEKEKDKAFFLFKNVLQSTGKAAVGSFIMREKEYTCIILSYKSGLLLTTLNYAYEIRNIDEISELRESISVKEDERMLAQQLIEKLTKDEFDITQFKDTFEEHLKEILLKKERGEPIVISKIKGKLKREVNLVNALRASLNK